MGLFSLTVRDSASTDGSDDEDNRSSESTHFPLAGSAECETLMERKLGSTFPSRRKKPCISRRSLGEALLVFILVAESLYFLCSAYKAHAKPRPFGPILPEKVVIFGNAAGLGPDLVYAEPEMLTNRTRNNEIHENWQALFPKGRGYVTSPYSDPWEHAVPPMDIHGVVKDWQPAYILSVYHQLHCLSILASRLGTSREEFRALPENKVQHTSHCIEYLRQSILCSADTSLEGETGSWSDPGWGQKHVCKDFDALLAFSNDRSAWDLSQSRRPNITADPTDRGSYDLVPDHHA